MPDCGFATGPPPCRITIDKLLAVLAAALFLGAGQGGVDEHLSAARRAEAAQQFQAAESEYERALSIRPDGDTYQRLGLVRHLQKKYKEAIPAFESAVRLKPDLWGAYVFLGIDLYRVNEFSRALGALERADALKPGQRETRFWIGVSHIAMKHYLEGQEVLEELSRTDPGNLEILQILAQSYSDYATALHNRVTAEYPRSAWAHRIHGQALENEGYCGAALEEYRTARALQPAMPGIDAAIARCSGKPAQER